ncbi:acetyltransferase [Rhabdobacter roseus]|uniref:Sugar O-acyltransferase (Sialic acid O-acetyltransferase NeuD family) n=1 Tax=Rhabdobacter roseus TaxID=1655419 RepID=A0A840TK27_9BACT|nr:acetyltransferase [Rhabdobacter roseus]MBB5281902.1 sugar O-acyltransferase (sialic acid O-acetyltransferase NeuD family) [Rhabdobacter roseus]
MENPVLIFGAGSLGRQAFDIFQRNEVLVYGFLDDNAELHGQEIGDVTILGDTDDGGFLKLLGAKCEAFIAIGERSVRQRLVEMLIERRKIMPVNAIHNTAVVSAMATLGHGNLVAARTVIAPSARLGHHCQLQTGAILEAFVEVGDYVNIGAGAILNDRVKVGDNAFIGPGAILVAGIEVGKNARIGAGSVVIENVPAKGTVFGNPAQKVK